MQRRDALVSAASVLLGPALPGTLWAHTEPATAVRLLPASFTNEGVTLVGNLYLPPAEADGGIVLVHGNGRKARIDWAAHFFARRGLAVLSYDKRGVGKSGGTYEELDNASATNLALLAADAAAGMEFLRRRSEMTGRKLGYWGISQAGWIIPIAVLRSAPVDFTVLWSGPVCTATEELEAGLANDGNLEGKARVRAYIAYLRSKGLDTDPRDALRQIRSPGLWIYGGRDATQPVQLSMDRLQSLIDAGQTNFAYWLNSAAGHDDFDANSSLLEAAAQWMLGHARGT